MAMPVAVLLSVLLMLGAVLWRSIRAHGRIELRARIMELVARALERGRSLPGLFERLDAEFPRRGLDQTATALSAGAPLADALSAGSAPLFPTPWPDLVRAVEGDGRLAGVLRTEAHEQARQGRFFERLLLSLVYPGILVFGACSVHQLHGRIHGSLGWQWLLNGYELNVGVIAIVFALTVAFLALRLNQWPAWLPRLGWSRRTSRARILRVVSTLLESGVPLHQALRCVQPLGDTARLRNAIAQAADVAAQGGTPGETLAFLGVARSQRARIAGATGTSLLERLRAVASQMERRLRTRQQRILTGLRPGAVLVIGAFVLVGYAAFMQFLVRAQQSAMPW